MTRAQYLASNPAKLEVKHWAPYGGGLRVAFKKEGGKDAEMLPASVKVPKGKNVVFQVVYNAFKAPQNGQCSPDWVRLVYSKYFFAEMGSGETTIVDGGTTTRDGGRN